MQQDFIFHFAPLAPQAGVSDRWRGDSQFRNEELPNRKCSYAFSKLDNLAKDYFASLLLRCIPKDY